MEASFLKYFRGNNQYFKSCDSPDYCILLNNSQYHLKYIFINI